MCLWLEASDHSFVIVIFTWIQEYHQSYYGRVWCGVGWGGVVAMGTSKIYETARCVVTTSGACQSDCDP